MILKNNEILDKDVEGIGINYSSQMIDEEEVRVDKQLIYGTKVKNIIIDRININSIKLMNSLSKMFDIPNYNKEYGDEIDQLNKEYGDDVISMKELDEGFRILDKKYNDKIIPLDIKDYNSLEKKILDLKKKKFFFDKKIDNNSKFYKNFFLQLENQYYNLFKE